MGWMRHALDWGARGLGYLPVAAPSAAADPVSLSSKAIVDDSAPPRRGPALIHDLRLGRHATILVTGFFLIFGANWLHDFLHEAFLKPDPPGAVILLPKAITDLLMKGADAIGELGIAFVIAFIVSSFVEMRAARRHIRSLDEARDNIEKDVHRYFEHAEKRFKRALEELDRQKKQLLKNAIIGAFQMGFDESYVAKALDTVFADGVIRENYDLDFRITELTLEDFEEFSVNPGRYVKLTAEANYRIVNVTQRKISINSKYSIPVRQDIPDANQLTDLQVGARRWSKAELSDLVVLDDEGTDRDYPFEVEIPPGEGVKIMTRSVLIKDRSDNEPFGFVHPTNGLTLHVSSEITTLEVGADARTASKMEKSKTSEDKRYGEWKVNGAILPYDSVVIWWRPKRVVKRPTKEPTIAQPVSVVHAMAESTDDDQVERVTERREKAAPGLHQEQPGGKSSSSAAPNGDSSPERGAK